MHRKESKKSTQQFIIYVAGIPKKLSRQGLYEYFGQFGSIKQINLACVPYANIQENLEENCQKGYCYLSTECWATFSRIVSHPSHSLLGREIYCTKYQEGSKLMRQNRMNNQRKAIIRGVPHYLDMKGLRLLLEATIGPIELMYQFKDSTLTKDCPPHNATFLRSFTVMFQEKACAQFLLELKHISLNETTMNVEKFRPASKRTKVSLNSPTKSALQNIKEAKETLSSEDSTYDKASVNPQPSFLGAPIDFLRPTSKMYHALRIGLSQNLQEPIGSRCMPSTNLRINQPQSGL
jgi:RNA recognition motif-containing protein